MKKVMMVAALVTLTACGGAEVNEENIRNQLSDAEKAVRGAADSLLAQFQGKADPTKTEQAKAETGETTIGETATDATVATPDATAEQTVEQKVEAARQAVTTIIPTGKYDWKSDDGSAQITINADGSVVQVTDYGTAEAQMRKVGEDMCFEQFEAIGNCYSVTGPDDNGVYLVNGTNNDQRWTVTPIQ